MENSPAEPPLADPSPPAPHRRIGAGRWWLRPARWAGELATVFVGVYAAFVLNNYQSHRQERQRREQMLDWAQAEYAGMLTNISREETHLREGADAFNRKVKAGEMPPLHAFHFVTDYNPADFTTLLQSGGFDLLDIQTVRAIREVEGSLRQMVEIIQHDQRLSDAMILPALSQPPSYFYDPATRKLQPGFAWYAEYFDTQLGIYAEMHGELVKVLAQIRAERERNR